VESFERAFTAAWLSRRCRAAVFGEMNADWPVRAERAGHVAFGAMAGWYRRGVAGLNVMRWQDDVGVNLKPLEIGASGVACVCGRRAGVEALFEDGKEIVTFDGPAGALEAVRTLRESPARAREIGEAARARVEREHTWAHRAAVIARALAETRAGVKAA
jgi:spore maturation protein CgeB